MRNSIARATGTCLSAAILIVITATGTFAWKNPMQNRYTTGPLDVCDVGAFFVGGVPKVTNFANSSVSEGVPQQLIIGQMYAQFMIPKKHRKWPIIMVHGGGYTGSALESTPQGTEGWAPYALRKNLATFVVDQAGRGRSGFDRSGIHEARVTNNPSLIATPNIGQTASNGIFTGQGWGHLIPDGSTILDGTLIRHGDPGDPECGSNPDHCTFNPPQAYDIIDPKIEAREGAIGPAPNPANNTYLALETYKWGVPNTEHTLPSSTCSTCSPQTVNAPNTWSARALAELVVGLDGAIVATHSQSGAVAHHMVRLLKEEGHLDKLKGHINVDGICPTFANTGTTAADYVNVPYLAFRGYYPGINDSCIPIVNAIKAAGGTADFITLADANYGDKFKGVGHMMMFGTNALEVFDEILKWSEANIPNPIVQNACPNGPKPGKGPKRDKRA